MDAGEIVPEKHLSNGRGKNISEIFQVRDLNLLGDLVEFLNIFWAAWLFVKAEDKSNLVSITLGGKKHDVPEIEALLYWYLHDEHSKVKLAIYDNEIAGFIIYNDVVEGVLAIRWAYIKPEYHGTKMSHRLVDTVAAGKTVIFQTQKSLSPKILFKRIKDRATKLSETELLETWFMKWESK